MPGFYNRYLKLSHSLGDIAAVIFSIYTSHLITDRTVENFTSSAYSVFLLYALFAWLVSTIVLRTYKHYRVARTQWILFDAIKAILFYIILLEAVLNIVNYISYSREFLLFHYTIFGVLVFGLRLFFTYTVKFLRKKGYNNKRVIIVGKGSTGKELKNFFYNHPQYGYKFLGYFDDNKNGSHVIGKVGEVEQFALEHNIDEIYCCPFSVKKDQLVSLMDFADNNLIRLKFLPEPGTFTYQRHKINFYDLLPVLVARNIPLDDAINKLIKRTFDIIFSILVIIFILSWLLPILAIIIKVDSKGPIFFSQERSGINYTTFRCWKLRSMYVNSEANSQLARRGDSRITPVGAFLRKTSLDELPQFFNVLIGHMSVVGPRPHMLKVNQEYSMVAEKYMVRHFVKPGVTGLSQVRGYRGDTTSDYQVRGRVRLDIFYLERWTFFLDLKIIFYTVYNSVKGDDHAF